MEEQDTTTFGGPVARTTFVGLDIGTTHVRAAEVEHASGRKGSQPTLLRYGQVPLPLGAVRDGEVAEPDTIASALRQLWQQAKFSTKDVVLGVGNQRVLVRELEMPAMPMDQIRASLPFQVQDLLPVAIEDALLDYYPTHVSAGANGPAVQGLLVAATKDTVQANTLAAESASLRPVMVDLTGFALSRVQIHGELAGRTVALVDIGARTTTVVIVAHGVPTFIRMLPSGGQDVTDAVTSTLSCSAPEAEHLKREIGVGMQVHEENLAVAEQVAAVTQTLVESVRNTLVYYAGTHPGAAAELVILSGGGSHLPGLGQYLASASRIRVERGEPLAPFRLARTAPARDALPEVQKECAVSVGLALGVAG